jgi:hypothetical protein
LREKLFPEQIGFLLKVLETIVAKAIAIALFQKCFQLRFDRNAITLALRYIARFAFK